MSKNSGRSIPMVPKELPDEDSYPAALVGFVDLGTQPARTEGWDDARKCSLVFELLGVKKENGKPFLIAKEETYSGSPKANLMKNILTPWLGVKDSNYNMEEALGRIALVGITHSKDGQYANISTITKLPSTMKSPGKPKTELYSLFLDDTFDKDVFAALTDYTKTKIAASPEYAEIIAAQEKGKKGKAAAKKTADKGKGKK